MTTARRKFLAPVFVIEHADELEDTRKGKGLTRREVSDQTGVRIDYISQYERGYCFPSRENYNKLAKYFDWEEWE